MLLETEHLTKAYGSFRALDDLTLSVAAGEVVGLLGPNGSGKTTALRLLLGFLRPTRGHARVGGHDCWSDGVLARRQMAYLPGELRLYERMTGRQLVRFLAELRGGTRPVAEVDDLARRFDIDVDRPIAHLSSGMKRKVALLQVLAPHAPLIIMDEPTNALDPTMRDELLEQVRRARDRGQAVLFSSHVLAEVEAVCDRVAVLQRGRLVHLQALSELQEGRLVHARFALPPGDPAPRPPALPGLLVRASPPAEGAARADQLTLEYSGPLPELLGWLASQPLTQLSVEPLGLDAIYHRYHAGATEEGRNAT